MVRRTPYFLGNNAFHVLMEYAIKLFPRKKDFIIRLMFFYCCKFYTQSIFRVLKY